MSLERRLVSLEANATGGEAWVVPIEVRILTKAVARHQARTRGEEPPLYTVEELEEMHREDLAAVAGSGVVGELRESVGWQSEESCDLLRQWEEDARERLDRIEDGETLEAVYNEDELEGDE